MQQNIRDLIHFVDDARANGMSNDEITEAAEALNLWNSALIRAAVAGVDLTPFTTSPQHRHEDFNTIDGDFPDGDDIDFFTTFRDSDADETRSSQAPLPLPAAQHDDDEVSDYEQTPETPPPVSAQEAVYGGLGAGTSYHHHQNVPHESSTSQQQQHQSYAAAPPPPAAGYPTAPAREEKLPILQTVLHHVSLWVFLLFSIPAIVYLVNFLFSDSTYFGDLTTLTSFAAIIIVSGGLYAATYSSYLRKMKRHNDRVRTGKIFAILTITGSTIGAVISGIVLLNNIINAVLLGEDDVSANILSSFLVTVILLATILTYHATDIRATDHPHRRGILRIAPAVTGVVLLGLFFVSAFALPGALSDKRTVEGLVDTTETVRAYADEHDVLPDAVAFQSLDTPDNIRYEYVSSYEYQLCADFQRSTDDGQELYRPAVEIYDDSVSTWTFQDYTEGENCFKLQNRELYNKAQHPPYEPYPIEPMPLPYPDPTIGPAPEPRQ